MFSRTEKLIGKDSLEKLATSSILLFGVGGVGSYVLEALVRGGVGTIHIVDNDDVALSNINRQLVALQSTVGMAKVDVAVARARDINPNITIIPHKTFFLPENAGDFDFASFDYVIDAVDTVTAKISIIQCAKNAGVPVISSMGTGNKLHGDRFHITDISKTSVCPLARVMRRELKARHITKVKVLWSDEQPVVKGGEFPASCSFVPSVAGLLIAGEVIRDLTGLGKQ